MATNLSQSILSLPILVLHIQPTYFLDKSVQLIKIYCYILSKITDDATEHYTKHV